MDAAMSDCSRFRTFSRYGHLLQFPPAASSYTAASQLPVTRRSRAADCVVYSSTITAYRSPRISPTITLSARAISSWAIAYLLSEE
ncbi:hypothetical protein J6590_043101 [Homalodisca vitripennis]|nr:hypothetical protein J6590_043101 [Homalodisca vitripennis]